MGSVHWLEIGRNIGTRAELCLALQVRRPRAGRWIGGRGWPANGKVEEVVRLSKESRSSSCAVLIEGKGRVKTKHAQIGRTFGAVAEVWGTVHATVFADSTRISGWVTSTG